MLPFRKISFAFLSVAVFLSAQGRLNDKDLQNLMGNLKDDAKSFRNPFNSALKKSTIRKTSEEKEDQRLAETFQKQTEAMHDHFKGSKKMNGDLDLVQRTASQIDQVVARLSLGPQVTSRWQKIQTELQQISMAFGTPYTASGSGGAFGDASNPQSCERQAGPERAKRMVEDCLAVSSATRPPCNVQNSCRMIVDEIRRSCASMDSRNAPQFCKEYTRSEHYQY
jgi:hypothetical protein